MSSPALSSLVEVFAQVRDFRDPRGKRHPLSSLLSLVFLGLLARIREMAVLERWAEAHWDELKEPLYKRRVNLVAVGQKLSQFTGAVELGDGSLARLVAAGGVNRLVVLFVAQLPNRIEALQREAERIDHAVAGNAGGGLRLNRDALAGSELGL